MKIVVKEVFIDKNDNLKQYQIGETLDFDNDRADNLIKRGLASTIEVKVEAKAEKKVVKKTPKK